jgi:hypothetical protein
MEDNQITILTYIGRKFGNELYRFELLNTYLNKVTYLFIKHEKIYDNFKIETPHNTLFQPTVDG